MSEYEWIGPAYRDQASTQTYGGRQRIDGVELTDLALFGDEGGDFCEIGRFNPDGTLAARPSYRPAQASYSFMEPGTIKAWHLHREQDDLWFVAPHVRLLVGLLDTREDASTYRVQMRLMLGGGKARLLFIPRGVAHGVANMSSRGAQIIYFTNAAFDPHNPDEHRLPWDMLGADFWRIQPG